MGNPVVHFEIVSKNARAIRAFYTKAFEWNVDAPMPGAGISDYTLVHPGTSIDGGIGSTPPGYDGHATFYIGVPDINATIEKIKGLGATIMLGPEQVPNGPVIALFRDPDGHTVGLVETP